MYPNKTAHTIVEILLMIKQDTMVENKRQQYVVIFHHDAFNTAEVYCVKQWAKLTNEVSEEHLFRENKSQQILEALDQIQKNMSP